MSQVFENAGEDEAKNQGWTYPSPNAVSVVNPLFSLDFLSGERNWVSCSER